MHKLTLVEELKKIVTLLPDLADADPIKDLIDLKNNQNFNKDLRLYLTRYLRYYNLPEVELTIGKIQISDFDVVVQIYNKPIDSHNNHHKAVVFFIHGYLDHFGLYKNYINLLIEQGYIVVGIDLPGHGLSTGKFGDIVDFGQYAHSLEVMIDVVKLKFVNYDLPYYITSFSAGCAFAIEYLLRNSDKRVINKGLFYAPLLRTTYWHFNELAGYLTPFVKFVPRQSRNISHNPAFVNFIRYNDPLQSKFIPLRWVRAMQDWIARLPKYKPIDTQLLIIQGTEDKTVDWNYNIPYIAKIFPNHMVHYIAGGYHNLLNESALYNDRVFNYVSCYLNN